MLNLVEMRELRTHSDRRSGGISHDFIRPLFVLSDAFIIVCASVLGNAVYWYIVEGKSDLDTYAGIGLFSAIGYSFAASYFQLYQPHEFVRPRVEYEAIFASWLFVILLLSVFFFLMKLGSQISRGSIICFSTIAISSLVLWRVVAKRIIRKQMSAGTIRGRRALVVGTSDELVSISSDYLLAQHGIDEAARVVMIERELHGPNSSMMREAVNLARTIQADEVIVALPWGNTRLIENVRDEFKVLPLRVRLAPDRFVRSLMVRRSTADLQSQLIDIISAPLSRTDQFFKRCIDIIGATAAILMLSPFMAVTALLVRLDVGAPAIFRQRRRGFNGQEFVIYKFRTMRAMEDGQKIIQAKRNDPRVTRLGVLLRRFSIDELPQLFNVLKGQMSLVGPRPHPVALDNEYSAQIGDYAFRHHVKPGITGLAQVQGLRGETKHLEQMKNRIELDIKYIDDWSLWLDVGILARTFIAVFSSPNAY
jgi:Undecaprenyl-phosphate glucose phosphotransferase